MNIKLYTFLGRVEDANKQENLTLIKEIDAKLKNDTNVVRPKLECVRDESLLTCNYAYIPAFQRYYYVSVSLENNLTILDLKVDTLYSVRNAILNSVQYVTRCEDLNFANLNINDSNIPLQANKEQAVIEFSKGEFNIDIANTDTHNYVAIIGGTITSGGE